MTIIPNSRDVTFMSRGIGRNMQLDGRLLDAINTFNGPGGPFYVDPNSFEAIPRAAGGGNNNGSANDAHKMGQAGTAGDQLGSPRMIGSTNHNFAGTPNAGAPPTISTAPFAQQVANAVNCTDGNWSTAQAAPVWKNYVWRRDGVVIAGGANAIGVTAGDNGHAYVCTVIAVNGFGSGSSASNSVTVTGAV
jgi:hypothetical protein